LRARSFPLVTLVILDGFGCAPPGPGNAVELADTPVFDELWRRYPHTTIEASGEAAGLPAGQMGNSEVGHLTIGAGRRLYQDLVRVNRAVADGSLLTNDALLGAFERGRRVHLLGLVSHGGVHSHIDHLKALLEIAPEKTWIHAFTDGRDVSPTSARRDLAELPVDRIATIVGRYYAMDRDNRLERTQRAYDAIVNGEGKHTDDPIAAVEESYEAGVTDEFIEPVVVDGTPRLEHGDTAVFFNFRPDRARQLTRMLLEGGFDVTTMTRYASDIETPVAFEEQTVSQTIAEVLASHGLKQLHVAETEKYAHVTYFFNGGREDAWPGETRILVPSPRDVPSYDKKPAMSADEVAARAVAELPNGYAFCVVNFANPDMVGHTGSIPAVIEAVETTDRCLGEIARCVEQLGGVCLVTADHGNAEVMLEPDGVRSRPDGARPPGHRAAR
jgi:2,3-bisphosphoglycerate-independent phosphoglycerate mutase